MEYLNKIDGDVEPIFTIETGSQRVLDGAQSTVINSAKNESVLISAIGNCYIKTGTNPTASSTDSMYLAIGTIIPLRILKGQKIAVSGADITITQ